MGCDADDLFFFLCLIGFRSLRLESPHLSLFSIASHLYRLSSVVAKKKNFKTALFCLGRASSDCDRIPSRSVQEVEIILFCTPGANCGYTDKLAAFYESEYREYMKRVFTYI